MPIIKSAIKKMRQDAKRKVRNNRTKVSMRSSIREFTDAVKEGKDAKTLSPLLSKAFKATDTAAKKNLIHKNNASHKKSRLAKMMPNTK